MRKQIGLPALIHDVSNRKGAYPALKLVQQAPDTAALVSKLVQGDLGQFDIKRKNAEMGINAAQVQSISDSIRARTRDNESIIQLFPDIKLAVQILISSILSPKDMVKTELIYGAKEPIFSSELLSSLNSFVESEMEGYHKLKDDLQPILQDSLFDTGSYVKVVLPESIVDSMINEDRQISNESMLDVFEGGTSKKVRPLGFLGNSNQSTGAAEIGKARPALEAFFAGNTARVFEHTIRAKPLEGETGTITLEHLEITDNFQLLKLPKLIEVGNRQKAKALAKSFAKVNKSYTALESANNERQKKLTTAELSTILYKDPGQGSYQHMMVLPSAFNKPRRSVGRPLVMRLPSESVIPVYVPGDEKKHIGYFVLIDADGNPVNKESQKQDQDGLAGLLASQNNNQNMNSLLIDRAKKNMVANNASPTLDNIAAVYASIVENDLLERLNNGLYGANVEIGKNEEIYRIMVARALRAKFTRLVYVPIDFASYFAFDYFPNGVGKSYLDDVKNLTSIRAILLFAKTMAQVKAAINVTKVTMSLDPNDPDPQKTIEIGMHEVAKMRQMYFPLGINSPVDLADWIQRAGIEFAFENHPGIPETKFQFDTDNFKHEIPDNELDDALRKQTYMAFGLTPEMVDNGFNAEFATTVVQNNILLSKRIMNLQDIFTAQLTAHVHRVVNNDEVIREGLRKLLKENRGQLEKTMSDEDKALLTANETNFIENVIDRYIENLVVQLPRPDVTTLDTQSEAFEKYEAAVEKAIEFWVSTAVIPNDVAGNVSSNMDSIKGVLKAYYMRNWMATNNYLPELAEMVTADEDAKPILDLFEVNKAHIEGLVRSFLKFAKEMNPVKIAADNDLNTLGTPEGQAVDTSTSTSDAGGGFGDFGGGGLDMPELDLDTDTDAAPAGEPEVEEETTPENPEAAPEEGAAPAGASNNESIAIDPSAAQATPVAEPSQPAAVVTNNNGVTFINP